MALDKLVNSTALDAALRYTANRIRAKTGGSENLPFDMSEENPKGFGDAVDDIQSGGGVTPTGTKEITITENGTTTEDVTNYAAAQITVNVPSSGGVDWDGFANGSWPTGNAVLSQSVTTVTPYMFYNKSGITSVTAPGLTTIPGYGFNGLPNVERFSLPNVTSLAGGYALSNCGKNTANGCIVALPSIQTLTGDCFRGGNGKFQCIDFGEGLSSIPVRAIYQGTFFNIVLRKKDGIVEAVATSSIGSGAAGGLNENSTVWVPAALLSAYEADANWSSAKTQTPHQFSFATIEGSSYENYYADGTPVD